MASHLALNNNVAPNAWWNIDPNRVLGLYGPANRYEFLETPYLYPRVAYTVDPIPALPQYTTFHIARNRRRAIEKTYVFMDNRVRNRNYVGSGLVNAIPGQITSQHEFRIFCATLYETIRGPRPSSARDSRINETGEPRERVLTIMGQGYLHNFHHLLKHATRVHLTYVIDIQGILEACAQLGWHMAACTQTQIPVGPLRLYHLERIFHTLLNNPRIDPHPLNVPKHVCFNVILRLKRITGPNARQNHLNICNAVMDQFHRAILTLPVPQRDIIRSVNIWEAFGPMRAPPQSAYGGDHRIQLNNPGMCQFSLIYTYGLQLTQSRDRYTTRSTGKPSEPKWAMAY